MKLTRIDITNTIGVRRFAADLRAPVLLVAGKNGAGKTSILQAVRLALTGEMPRVSLKKDAHKLVSDGAKTGTIAIEWASGGRAVVALPDCKLIEGAAGDIHAAMPFVCDTHRFAGLDDKERRTFLFALTGTKTSADDVQKRLLDRGADQKRIDAVLPLLRSGFPAAHKEAAAKVSEARGAWKAVTGEAYGSVKAATWSAPKAPDIPDGDGIKKLHAEVDRLDADLEAESRKLGGMVHALEQSASRSAKIAGWQQTAGQVDRLTTRLNHDKASRDELKAIVEEARRHGQGKKAQSCPECGAALIVGSDGAIAHFVREPGDDTGPEAAERLPDYEKSLALLESAVKNTERDLNAACYAAQQIKDAEQEAIAAPTEKIEADAEACRVLIADIKARREAVQKKIAEVEAIERARADAEKRTKDAASHHADVVAWELISSALAPDGIPGELLAQALDPINKLLAQSAADTGWSPVTIDADMAIRAGGRPYGLLSESEQWRADAMMAVAVAMLSGVKLALFDRLDVLDIPSRGVALGWFDTLASAGEIDTLIVAGTLKAIPASLPDTHQAVWIENGAVVELKAAA